MLIALTQGIWAKKPEEFTDLRLIHSHRDVCAVFLCHSKCISGLTYVGHKISLSSRLQARLFDNPMQANAAAKMDAALTAAKKA
jgi:hypothetical protein